MTGELEQTLGHHFSNRKLLASASSVDSRAFGALEHLGDAIADLAVGITCWQEGHGPELAAQLVSNDHLDSRFELLLRGLVNAASGDVIEALVGATFLDANFDTAAGVALRLCSSDLQWSPLGVTEIASAQVPPWLGSAALDAVVTALAIKSIGVTRTSQKKLNDIRKRTVSSASLRTLVSRHFVSEELSDQHPESWFKQQLAHRLLASGWDAAVTFGAPVLTLSLDT